MAEPAKEIEPEAPTGSLTAITPEGVEGTIPADQAGYFARRGYKVETPEETAAREYDKQEGLAGTAKAFAGNAASSLTLGGSDVLGGAIGGDEFRRARALQDLSNPIASTAGQVAGMVAPALFSGGGSLGVEGAEGLAHAAQGAHALAEAGEGASALSRVAGGVGKALRWTPGGATLRAGEAASELTGHALGALGLTGESALGRAALTGGKLAVAGGLEGAAFGAGGALSEAALAPGGDYDGLAEKLLAGGVEGAKFGAITGGALGATGSLLASSARRLAGTFDAARSLEEFSNASSLKRVGFQGSDIQKIAPERRAALAHFVDEGSGIGWLDTVQDASGKLRTAKDEAGELLGSMRKSLDEHALPGEAPNVRAVLSAAEDDAAKAMLEAKTRGAEKMVQKFSEELDTMKKNIGNKSMSFEESHLMRREIDDGLTNYGKSQYPTGGSKRPPDLFEKHMMGLRSQLETEFENAGERVMSRAEAEGATGAKNGITTDFRNAYHEAKNNYGITKELEKVSTKRSGSLAGNSSVGLRDAIMGGAGLAALGPKGIALAAASKVLRSAPAVSMVGRLAGHLASLDEQISNSVGKWVKGSRQKMAAAEAAVVVPHHNIAQHVLEKTGEITHSTAHATAHVRQEAPEHLNRASEYYRKLTEKESVANSPVGSLAHIEGAPETSAAVDRQIRKTAQYIVSQAPRPPAVITNPLIARMARQTPPNAVELLQWGRQVRVAENPISVLKDLQEGRLKKDQVETLKTVAPSLLDAIRKSVVEQVTDADSDLHYSDRVQLGTLLGIQIDPSLRPEVIALAQESYAAARQAEQAQQQQAQQASPSVPGNAPHGVSSRLDNLEQGFGV